MQPTRVAIRPALGRTVRFFNALCSVPAQHQAGRVFVLLFETPPPVIGPWCVRVLISYRIVQKMSYRYIPNLHTVKQETGATYLPTSSKHYLPTSVVVLQIDLGLETGLKTTF